MRRAQVWTFSLSLTVFSVMPRPGQAQTLVETLAEPVAFSLSDEAPALPPPLGRWDFAIGGRVGAPIGHLQVGEFHGGQGTPVGGAPGTRLSLNTLGIHVSEAIEASAAFHFTENDA